MSNSANQFSVEFLGRDTLKMPLASSVFLALLQERCGGCGWFSFVLFFKSVKQQYGFVNLTW